MLKDIDDPRNYMQRSHDRKFKADFTYQWERNLDADASLPAMAAMMGIRYDHQFIDNVRRISK